MFRTDQFVSDQVILREQTLSGNKNLNIPQEDPSSPLKHSPIPQRHSSVPVWLMHTETPREPGECWCSQASAGPSDCGRGWIWFCFSSKEGKDAFSYRKRGRLQPQWLNILDHSVHTQNHSPLCQTHTVFSLQFALQSLFCSLALWWPFPFFLRHTQHK